MSARGGIYVGGQHDHAEDIPVILKDTNTHLRIEGGELNLPLWIQKDKTIYTFTGKNYEILERILKMYGYELTDKVTDVRAGDIVICIRSAWDDEIRTYTGTIIQILSAINESCGCRHVASGATMTEHSTGETFQMGKGGAIPNGFTEEINPIFSDNIYYWKYIPKYKARLYINIKRTHDFKHLITYYWAYEKKTHYGSDWFFVFPFIQEQHSENLEEAKKKANTIMKSASEQDYEKLSDRAKKLIQANIKRKEREEKEKGGKLAPNGKSSNLNPVQYKLVRTPEFKKWFGDWEKAYKTQDYTGVSMVVDENGEPLMVYHGTTKDFHVFDITKGTKNTKVDWGNLGFFFTPNYSLAEDFTRYKWAISEKSKIKKGSRIITVFLNIRIPNIISAREFSIYPTKIDEQFRKIQMQEHDGWIITKFEEEDKQSWIRLFGEEGIKEFLYNQYVAFEPEQIKLADGSNTTFNPNNPDIRKINGGELEDEDEIKYSYNKTGGLNYEGKAFDIAERCGLVTLPEKIKGTNCANCIFFKDNFCDHKAILLPVTSRMCCEIWDNKSIGSIVVNLPKADFFADKKHDFKLNDRGGYDYTGDALLRAQKVDLITLPPNIEGTNCSDTNCTLYGKNNFCIHKRIQLPITDRMSCAWWDNEDVIRPWGKPVEIDFSGILKEAGIIFERGARENFRDGLTISYGEAGTGIYAYIPNSSMRNYYTSHGETLVKFRLKENSEVVDLTKESDKVIEFIKSDFPRLKREMQYFKEPKVTKDNFQRFGNDIMQYMRLNHPDASAYIVPHKGIGIPTGKQVVILKPEDIIILSPQLRTGGIAESGYKTIKGKDVLNRDIPDWRGAIVYHSTDKKSAEDIAKNGYRILGEEQGGYYGQAVSFTPDLEYTSQFGDVTTIAKVSSKAKILNLNDPADWEMFLKTTRGGHASIEEYNKLITSAGYDGLYDAGAGDLFIFNQKVMKYIGIQERKETGGNLPDSDDFGKSKKTPIFVINPTKDEIQSIISGTRRVTTGEVIQAASDYLRRNAGTGSQGSGTKPDKRREEEILRGFSELISISHLEPNKIGEGTEHTVYFNDEYSVIKINSGYFYLSWIDYFNSLLLHNYFFPKTAYELLGFTEKDGKLFSVVKQPFVRITNEPTYSEKIKKILADNGFVNTRNDDYFNKDLGVILEDLHDQNVIFYKDIPYFIDTIFFVKENVDKIYGTQQSQFKNGGKAIATGYVLTSYNYLKKILGNPTHENEADRIGWHMAIDPNHIGAVWTESDKPLKKIKKEKYHKWFVWWANEESEKRLKDALKLQVRDVDPAKQKEKDQKISAQRWVKKREHLQEISNNIRRLKVNVARDLKSEDEKEFLTALVIAVMLQTAERVGNSESAENGHFGVTGFQKKHLSVRGDQVCLNYIGKSGVKHEKTFSDAKIAWALKKAAKNSSGKFVFQTSDGFCIKCDKITRYLSPYNITPKDIRGYMANKLLIQRLEKELPKLDKKDLDESKLQKERKKIFNKAVRETAGDVGHGGSTLKKHYMVPELQDEFVMKGNIIDLSQLGYYREGGAAEENPYAGLTTEEMKKVPNMAGVSTYFMNPFVVPQPVSDTIENLHKIAKHLGIDIEELRASFPEQQIPFEEIIPMQEEVNADKTERYVSDVLTNEFPPVFVIKYQGKYYLNDGHHRVVAWHLNEMPIKAYIYELKN